MFKGKFSLLFFFTVFVTFLFFFNTTNEASSSLEKDASALRPPPPEIMEKIKAGPGVGNAVEKRTKLAEKIIQDYGDLKTHFDNKEPDFGQEMAKILGKKATIVFDDVTYRGIGRIKKFWVDQRETHQSVVFTLEWAFIVSEEMAEMEDFDHIAYEIFTFSLIASREGKILKNQDGRGGRSCRHILGCECRTR
jgi:hypothetical protein